MQITITLHCPNCQSAKIKKNGKKSCGKQNYLCKFCSRQFIGDHVIQYKGCHSTIIHRILSMLVRGIGIRDVSEIEKISIKKVLSVLVKSVYVLRPKQSHYETLEVDDGY
jgi:transposase-like protein